MRRGLFCSFVFALIFSSSTPLGAAAQSRIALVIGNGGYQHAPALPNPVNDATDVSAALEQLGFEVKTLKDAKFDDFRKAMLLFGQQARDADFAILFFAGHGMEMGGENWLIPVDAQLASDLDVPHEAMDLKSLMRTVSSARKLGLVILDACRNNPFLSKMQQQRNPVARSVERGFVRVDPENNVMVAYSAREGTTASDGSGRNSPFTSSLLKRIGTPSLDVRFLFGKIRDDVMAATQRQQQPALYQSLPGEQIWLNSNPPPAKPAEPMLASPSPPTGAYSPPSGATNAGTPGPTLAAVATSKPLPDPSFRCVGPLSNDEQAICGNSVLSSLDVELTSVFVDVKQTTTDVEGLINAQRAWVTRRRACSAGEACIERLYRSRIAELRMLVSETAQPSFCAGSLSPDERAICASPKLSSLDRKLNIAFGIAMGRSANTGLARDQQRNWLARRASCSADSACIAALYRERISELENAR